MSGTSWLGAAVALLLAAVLAPGAAHAQAGERGAPGRDTLPAARADTLPPGAAPGDTLPGDTIDVAGRRQGLAGGDFPARDSLFRRLLEIPGYRPVEYRGETAELEVPERRIHLRRRSQVNYGQDVLRADTITYLGRTRFLVARDSIELVGAGRRSPVTSDSVLYYDVARRKGTVYRARTQVTATGTNWYVEGNAIPVGQDTLFADPGSFSSCELPRPHYRFQAGRVKVVTQNVIVAWPVVLYVGHVPVAWLPFFAQDIRPGRRSGILPPRFGFNDVVRTSGGYDRHVEDFGYYWAINEFMDAEVTVDWFSGNYTRLNGRVRYNFMKDFLQGDLSVRQSYGDAGRSLQLSWYHNQEFSPDTRFNISADYVQNTQLFQDRSYDPRTQTQTISSDVGLTHRMDWANLSVSARRQQYLDETGTVDLTLPSLSLSFSPVTLFPAPRSRAGPFNNLTWNGSLGLTRSSRSGASRDQDDLRGNVNNSLRVGQFSLSSRADFRRSTTLPRDTAGNELPEMEETRTLVNWSSSVDYQLNLVGNTTLRPTASVDGALFRSDSTGGAFRAAPTRLNAGVSLSTDLYGFFPGFGSFSRIRHRISPRFDWRYSPATALDPELRDVPGFPTNSGSARNVLTVSLSQNFEAKVRTEASAPQTGEGGAPAAEEGGAPGDTLSSTSAAERAAPGDTVPGAGAAAPGDTVPGAGGAEAGAASGDTTAAGERAGGGAGDAEAAGAPQATGGPGTGRRPATGGAGGAARKVNLLSIGTSSLEFDFERAKQGLPVLRTQQLTTTLNSDLLRGFSLNMTHDLFAGPDTARTFDPVLTRVGASFSFTSGTGLGDIVGLGGTGGASSPAVGGGFGPGGGFGSPTGAGGPGRRQDPFEDQQSEMQEGGPWNLSLSYSLLRSRADEGGRESQTLGARLRLQPTPNWLIRWNTSYNITDGEFGQHVLSLERNLHRWWATFRFMKSPNGNFLFDVMVQLRDAPDVKVEYDQRTRTGG